jgi:hypothetical protein
MRWREWLVPAWFVCAAALHVHGYYPLADYLGWHLLRTDRATTGAAMAMLYAGCLAAALRPPRRALSLAAMALAALYGLSESAQMVACQAAWASMPHLQPRPGADACDSLLRLPVGAAATVLWASALSALWLAAGWRMRRALDPYEPDAAFVGYQRDGAGGWKTAATLFTWPWSGKVLVVCGVVYRPRRACGCWVVDHDADPRDFALRRLAVAPPIYHGMPWTLRHNCVTAGTRLWTTG